MQSLSNSSKLKTLNEGRIKSFLLENIHRSITTHDLDDCFQLLKIVPKYVTLDPYILFRLVFILIESNPTDNVSKNLINYLESMLSKLDVGKVDVFVEFLCYFIKNGRVEDARDLFVQRRKAMHLGTHRSLPYVELNLHCYELLLNYLDWEEPPFNLSVQGWIVNAVETLKSTSGNYEYFVLCVLRVLMFYGFTKKAYLLVSEFARNNQDNLSSQLLHYYLILHLETGNSSTAIDCDTSSEEKIQNRQIDLENINNYSKEKSDESIDVVRYPFEEDKRNIFINLRRIDPSCEELLGITNDDIDCFRDLMDGFEMIKEFKNMDRWYMLGQMLDKIISSDDTQLKSEASNLWLNRYRRFWSSVNLLKLAGKHADRMLVMRVRNKLFSELD